MPELPNHQIALFKGKAIRKTIFNKEWYFSVIDVVQTLIDQPNDYIARKYWNKLSQRLREEESQVVTNCHRLKLLAPDGKMRETDCASTEDIFRIVQSIPSPKAEPLKRWSAKTKTGCQPRRASGWERQERIGKRIGPTSCIQ